MNSVRFQVIDKVLMKKGFEPLQLLNYNLTANNTISFFPAARSRTATLLRLHPNCQFLNQLDKTNLQAKLALRM